VAFDLGKAREAVHTLENFAFASGKITAGQIQDVLWGARLLATSAAEIERLRAENAWLKSDREFQSEEQAARIKELEDALKEEKAWTSQYQKWLIEEVAEGMSENGFADDDLRQRARDSLLLDGKIGPDASKPRSWQITEARKAAIDRALRVSQWADGGLGDVMSSEDFAIIRAMLQEAGRK
jgi:DNA-directed RNA polymerase beta' subunit